MTQPTAGFSNKKVATYFNQPGATTTGSETSSDLHGGKIAGIAIGSIAGAAMLVVGAGYILIRRKRKRTAKDQENSIHEIPPESSVYEAPPDSVTARFAKAIFRNYGKRAEMGSNLPEVHEMDTGPQVFELPVRISRDLRLSEDKKD